jgi:hypothetical protein
MAEEWVVARDAQAGRRAVDAAMTALMTDVESLRRRFLALDHPSRADLESIAQEFARMCPQRAHDVDYMLWGLINVVDLPRPHRYLYVVAGDSLRPVINPPAPLIKLASARFGTPRAVACDVSRAGVGITCTARSEDADLRLALSKAKDGDEVVTTGGALI